VTSAPRRRAGSSPGKRGAFCACACATSAPLTASSPLPGVTPIRGLWSLGRAARCLYRALMAAGKECRLADGRMVALRPGGPDDVPAITRLYLELSSESFYRRFYTSRPAPELVAQFASFRSGTVCFVAAPPTDPGSLVAEARYIPTASGTAELALTVRHDYQGAGLGYLLLDALVERAHADGLDRLRAVVLLENTPMLRLLQHYGWALAAPIEDSSVAYLEISTIGGMPGWPVDSAGQRVLVERRSWFDDQQVAALRSAGEDIRQCTGPRHRAGRTCPLVASGRCRLAEGADVIVSLLPAGEPDCAAVLAAHRRLWPHRLAE
jgi:L-amino acid N-acyltransferase YncA